ncbi:MAG TPA: hypothetical protein VK737_10960 [Opitutales bacterium]|jgi:hypothetical protein|nr:hypothetical protein [Opitutales bacterium]
MMRQQAELETVVLFMGDLRAEHGGIKLDRAIEFDDGNVSPANGVVAHNGQLVESLILDSSPKCAIKKWFGPNA